MKESPTGKKNIARFPRPIRRFPRRNAEDIAFYRKASRIVELEKEARQWIARGREANIQLGRIFMGLKELVGHGHFKNYFELKFRQPYGIAFRTAQVYMQLARQGQDEEAKCADPALFPTAIDAQAVAITAATKKARLAVANAPQQSSDDATPNTDAHVRKDSKKAGGAMCTCRLFIRMTEKQCAAISALWRSEHRQEAESKVTELLMNLCGKYEVTSSDSADGRD